jgi:hypothetical protein
MEAPAFLAEADGRGKPGAVVEEEAVVILFRQILQNFYVETMAAELGQNQKQPGQILGMPSGPIGGA